MEPPSHATSAGLTTMHLEGFKHVPGNLKRPDLLPAGGRCLQGLLDLQLPDGVHVGEFFSTPLPAPLGQTGEGKREREREREKERE